MDLTLLTKDFKKDERVIVAMSGGVDSSVTAMLAKQAGCQVIGITLKMFGNDDSFYDDAKRVAEFLDIEWHLEDCTESFSQDVINHYIREYKMGRTPNPCSRCNRVAKTKYLFDAMQKYDATSIITGHYASLKNVDGQNYITKASDANKDQSYYLSLIEPFHLNLMKFPLGQIDKSITRKIAEEHGLPVANKPDSQEACFLMDKDYREFLEPYSKNWRMGDFTMNGKVLGKHKGIHNYTPGQRRGLSISYTEPLYVKSVDGKTGEVQLDVKKNVFKRGVVLRDCSFLPMAKLVDNVSAKLRYRMNDEPCKMEQAPDGKCFVLFDKPQFAPAKGQTVALYKDNLVVGGGTIDDIF